MFILGGNRDDIFLFVSELKDISILKLYRAFWEDHLQTCLLGKNNNGENRQKRKE